MYLAFLLHLACSCNSARTYLVLSNGGPHEGLFQTPPLVLHLPFWRRNHRRFRAETGWANARARVLPAAGSDEWARATFRFSRPQHAVANPLDRRCSRGGSPLMEVLASP